MHEPSPEQLLSLARSLALDAARISLAAVGTAHVGRKADHTVVTSVDHAIQDHLLQAIAAQFPDHAVVAEETVHQPALHGDRRTSRYCWVIDPLDGTRNYVAGFPGFATSIAVLDDRCPVVAVVADHNLGCVYSAVRGQGARLEARRDSQPQTESRCLRVVEPPPGDDRLIGFASTKDPLTVAVNSRWVATRGLVCRNIGSTALHMALVASGALAAAFCRRCKLWDIAAGILLITEAGGIVTDPAGRSLLPFDLDAEPGGDLPFLAGPPGVHQDLRIQIADVVRNLPT